ncbi:hypothetical protein [Cellulomonas iranensis]|uniref:hypothetical protein n=1 Tax=Cellulomonas iranensis TaxID=76862 RepID=UPI0013D3D434|nr:hypothetical protein [Cellulomonas iranensis]
MNPTTRVRMPRHTSAEEYLDQRVREAAAYHLANARRRRIPHDPHSPRAQSAWQVFEDAATRASVAAAEGLVYSESSILDTTVHAMAWRLLDYLARKHADAMARRQRAARRTARSEPTSGVTR